MNNITAKVELRVEGKEKKFREITLALNMIPDFFENQENHVELKLSVEEETGQPADWPQLQLVSKKKKRTDFN